MTSRSAHPAIRILVRAILALGCAHLDAAAAQSSNSTPGQGSSARDEVVISAGRFDRRTLDQVTIPRFVRAHAIASAKIDQLARWREDVCPTTQGLQPIYNEMVSRRIVALARDVGAPTQRAGRCNPNVEIFFSANPQQQLDYLAKSEPGLLGFSSGADAQAVTLSHPIQAWYVTGTRSQATPTARTNGIPTRDHVAGQTLFVTVPTHDAPQPTAGVQIDSQDGLAVGGRAGSRLGAGLVSEFVNVLVVVDSTQVTQYSLNTIADYVGMLALTRTSLGGCNELPSIIDLLSPDCGTSGRAETITVADSAYLKALYSASLEQRLNISQGEIHDRMLRLIVGQ